MTMFHSLWLRLVLALGLAIAGVWVLHVAVTAKAAGATGVADGRGNLGPGRVGARQLAVVTPSPLAALGFPLRPVLGTVLLASRLEAIPLDVAPVLQVTIAGTVVVRRAPPPPPSPQGVVATNSAGIGAALLLPRDLLGAGTPAARGAALEVLGAWLTDRPLSRERLRDVDLGLAPAELAMLLSWVP